MLYRVLFLLLLIFPFGARGAEVRFEGHLDKQRVEKALGEIEGTTDQLVVVVSSSSGNLQEVLKAARTLYRLRSQGTKVIVYIETDALGPAAILPFVADERYASVVASWGGIPLGAETPVPTNLLRSQVRALIPEGSPKILTLLADAMVDPADVVVDRNGWKLGGEGEVVSPAGETLIVHQQQLKQLGLVEKLLPWTAFEEEFDLAAPVEEQLVGEAPVTVDQVLAAHIKYNSDGPNVVGHIEIGRGMINQATWIHVKAALDHYKETKPVFVILELNTPGGEVFAAQQISDALKELDTNYNIPVVAFIDNWAISAGAMLAYSCRYIATVKDGAMGAAQPVMMGGNEGPKAASEKISSALRADFANRAGFFDRNKLLAEAMVDPDLILVYRFGRIVKLDSMDQVRLDGLYPDEVITAKGKLLTLNSEEMIKYDVANLMVPPTKVAPITEAEQEEGKWPASKSLLFAYPFFKEIPKATIDAYQKDWKTQFFTILSSPVVASLLFLGLMLGFYVEMNTPGFGVAGTIGLVCLFFVVLSSFALQAVNWLEVLLLLLGLVLIALEVFVLPGFGIAGILGIIFAAAGIIAMMLPGIGQIDFEIDSGTLNPAGEVVLERLAWLGGAVIVAAIIMVILSKYFMPKFSRFSRLVLRGEQDASRGYVAGPEISTRPAKGTRGVAATPLRPAGKVEIDGKIYDAVSPGRYLDKGDVVTVLRYEGIHMVVDLEEAE